MDRLEGPALERRNSSLVIRGKLLGQELTHSFTLTEGQSPLEERIVLRNLGTEVVSLTNVEIGLTRQVTDAAGQVLPDLQNDRWVAVPMRARATDP